jgi:hypothetical protein
MTTALLLFARVAPFNPRDMIQIIFVLAICGFALWILLRFVKMAEPFPQIIMFVVVCGLIWWLLTKFGVF